ncbi:MAG: hypothetical protein GF334_08980 [Candidatus Altiarchaeales archaeon]|nr:hypothetical protein [Candidatus Altiarchaeales archaeon]
MYTPEYGVVYTQSDLFADDPIHDIDVVDEAIDALDDERSYIAESDDGEEALLQALGVDEEDETDLVSLFEDPSREMYLRDD